MAKLVQGRVFPTVIRMAIPMLAGTFAINAYNLADTWFVSRLGTIPLAALSFTFPIVAFLGFITRGLAVGVMTVTAHAQGRGRHRTAARITTHAIFLFAGVSLVLTAAGQLTLAPLLRRLGASGEVLAGARLYLGIWYWGLAVRMAQMMFADVIIGTGNTKMVSLLMVGGTALNCLLDPLLIFGWGGCPRLGIPGAALATVASETCVLAGAFYFIHKKCGLIAFIPHSRRKVLASWRRILRVGIPTTISSILNPISSAVVIRIVSGFGPSAVAAAGVVGRIEMFAFMIPMTVGMSMVPFVAQNFGARRFDRIRTVRRGAMLFAVGVGGVIAAVLFFAARPLGGLFSSDPEVIDVLTRYLRITCLGYGLLEAHRYAGFCLTGIHRPLSSAVLNAIRVIVLLIPLVYLGAGWFGLSGIFWGRLVSDLVSGLVGIFWTGKVIGALSRRPAFS